jgi:hypothetical protein
MTGYPTYVGRMSVSCLTALELFAKHNTCRSERAPDLIVLLIDHTKLGIHCGRTRNDSSDANAKLHQHRNAHPYRAPAIGEAHHAGLIFKLFAQAVSLRMASLNSLSRSVQSSWRPLNDEKQEREETTALKIEPLFYFLQSIREKGPSHCRCVPLPPAAEPTGLLDAPTAGHSRPPPKKRGFRFAVAAARPYSSAKLCRLPSNRGWRRSHRA